MHKIRERASSLSGKKSKNVPAATKAPDSTVFETATQTSVKALPVTLRYVRVNQQQRDTYGHRLCLVCLARVPKGRRSYCSDECMYRNLPHFMRSLVRQRDKGICALCHTETHGRWEMDHIVPVCEGGGLCGLDGYRTLCIPCHKTETAELAARRAEARRPQQSLQFIDERRVS